jgi:uncharacterized repeat protein (TIGR03943 family)
VNRDDSGALVTLLGITAVTIGRTDLVARYLRPDMARWLTLAGAVMVALGIAVLVTSWRSRRSRHHGEIGAAGEDDHQLPVSDHTEAHHRASRVGWMLLFPVLVAIIVDPGALGSYSVNRQSAFQLTAAERQFDLDDYLRSRSFAGQAVPLTILQLWQAVDDDDHLDVLADTTLSLQGFVVHDDTLNDGFLLARLVIACCAGDASPISVEIHGDAATDLADDTWVQARVNLDRAATTALAGTDEALDKAAVVDLVRLDEISAPTEPYLYLW